MAGGVSTDASGRYQLAAPDANDATGLQALLFLGKATKPIAQVTGCAGGMKQGNAAVGNGTPATGAATGSAWRKGSWALIRKFNPNKSTQAVLQSVR